MKKTARILTLVMAALMCAGAFVTVGAYAATATTIEFIHHENFDNMFIDVPEISDCAGLWPAEDYSTTAKVKHDTATGNGYLDATCDSKDASVAAFVDFQIWKAPDILAMTEDFTLSMNVKLLGEWENSKVNFWTFRHYKAAAGEQLGMNTHQYFNITNGKFTMVTDNGNVSTDADIFDDYVSIDWAFKKSSGSFTSVTCFVNGEQLGTKTFSGAGLVSIDQFRMFYTTEEGQGVSIDSFAFTKGSNVLFGVDIPDSPEVRPPEPVPAAPEINEEDKVEMKYYFKQDFNDIEEVNISNAAGDIRAADGFWLNSGETAKYTLTEQGTLQWGGADFLDLQFYQVLKYRVMQDFVFSVKFKPLSEGISGHFVSQIRRDKDGAWTEYGTIQFERGCITVGDKNCGELPVNEWTLLEVAFDYDDEKNEFTSFTLLVNGNEVATEELDSALILTQIKHFRLFRVMGSMNFEIDDMCVVGGDKSVLYAAPYTEEDTPDDPDENEQEPEDDEPSEESDEKKDPPKTDTKPSEQSTEDVEDTEEKKGCSSTVSVGTVALICAVGAFVTRKRKEK